MTLVCAFFVTDGTNALVALAHCIFRASAMLCSIVEHTHFVDLLHVLLLLFEGLVVVQLLLQDELHPLLTQGISREPQLPL